jgi:surfeit locus 1 family protein
VAPRVRHSILIAVALIVAATCVRLGFWQLDRLQGRREANATWQTRGSAPAVPIGDVAPAELAYRHVTVTGTYDPAHEWILSGRTTAEGDPGNHVLTPLELGDGTAVVVDRGWVPIDVTGVPVTGTAAAPGGRVTVSGVALPPDQLTAPAISPAPSIATRVDLGRAGLPFRLLPVYLLLQTQIPPQQLPIPPPAPTFDNGPHLSYAIQWFAFATIAVVGCVVLLVRDRSRE